ncbi:MAG TPA: hypothetical protein VMH35_13195 [Streptosporangiaceae bacterium]|nr:hypothetical protein [Streptosporangiaceae bacterium]
MTSRREDMMDARTADPAGQSVTPDLSLDQAVRPPRTEPGPAQAAGNSTVPDGPAAADDDLIVLDDPAPEGGRAAAGERAAAGNVTVANEPGLANQPGAVPAPGAAAGGTLADDGADTTPAAALAEQQWPGIQALFVDDPHGAVERAAAAAGEVAAALVARLEREQAELRTSWRGDTDTEGLRTALQRYRAFCGRLEGVA